MSSCLSGGTGRAYGFDIENIVKCQSTTSSRTSHSSSPSSTLSESSNSPIAISNRKPRTPRKRPNQTYNEAAVLLSIACPKVFSTKNLTNKTNNNLSKFTKQHGNSLNEPPELLLPFPVIENSGFLIQQPIMEKPSSLFESKVASSCHSPREIEYRNCNSGSDSMKLCDGYQDDFDTESMLDEEIEGGIDSIMGSCNSTIQNDEKSCLNSKSFCYGYPMGLGFGGNLEFNFGFGMRNGVRALKNGDDGNWWSFPTVNVVNVSPPPVVATAVAPVKLKKGPVEQKKKRVEELLKRSESELGRGNWNQGEETSSNEIGSRLLLKLNYDDVLSVWSDKGSPLPEEISGSESPGGDIHARLARIDLFSENGALREASVMRYKEKKRTRLFSKKIRYQVRKVNADRRPRSKGRFVRRPNSPTCEDT
ncbi:hypothetical protein L6452_26989 [Arctium lappa]|uniref:Uncharacterized protein n=1 Tax=Arctium lappa TaxID=4217 RepID=A0ACB8ZUQ1_ARCLA|nr:hypothetical protein L6452_26989 [Arctium lappa]